MIDVDRPTAAPPSLARKKSYRGKDVLEALHAAFHGKCYLCETPIDIGCFEVDHRSPQGDKRFEHLQYEWTNLFPTCSEFLCNKRRLRFPDGELCSPGESIETRLVQKFERTVSTSLRVIGTTAFVFRAADPADIPAENAATELDHLHNGKGSFSAPQLRLAVLEHVGALEPGMRKYAMLSNDPGSDSVLLAEQKRWVERFIRRDAPFTMLVRSYFEHLDAVRALFD